jgi:hypothetical protein
MGCVSTRLLGPMGCIMAGCVCHKRGGVTPLWGGCRNIPGKRERIKISFAIPSVLRIK